MPATTSPAPALPPFVRLALRPLPLFPLQPALTVLLWTAVWRYPRIFDRLGEHAGKRFGLEAIDLPFAVVLEPGSASQRIKAVRRLEGVRLDARITGTFAALLGMVDGSYDGDALFFARALVVEGDVEAVVALRNSIDDAGIDLSRDVAALPAPLGVLLRPVLLAARTAAGEQAGCRGASPTATEGRHGIWS